MNFLKKRKETRMNWKPKRKSLFFFFPESDAKERLARSVTGGSSTRKALGIFNFLLLWKLFLKEKWNRESDLMVFESFKLDEKTIF